MKDTHINLRTNKKFKEKFYSFCKKRNYVPAGRLRALIQMDMEGKIKNR